MRESDQHILAERYLDLYQMAYSILRNESEAEDAVQEAVARTLAQPLVQQPLHYCMKVLRHCCLDRLDDRCVASDKLDTVAQPEQDPFRRLLMVRLELLDEARKQLPQRTNEMLDMHYVEGLPLATIAERTGVKVALVRKLFKRAYRQMRKIIITAEITDKS